MTRLLRKKGMLEKQPYMMLIVAESCKGVTLFVVFLATISLRKPNCLNHPVIRATHESSREIRALIEIPSQHA